MTLHPVVIGIDISKHHLDIFDAQHTRATRLDNTAEALHAFVLSLQGRNVLVVYEATGPYDARLAEALTRANIAQARVNPARARAFARAAGFLAKTDAVDARMLAAMGQALALTPQAAADPQRRQLTALVKRRDQLVAMRKQEKARRAEMRDADLAADLDAHIAWLSERIAELEARIHALFAAQPELARRSGLLRSVPGIGPTSAAVLLALLPELGCCSRQAIAALAGLAPLNVDSGRHRGQRHIGGGRARLRTALYMAAVTAARSHSRFQVFYAGLRRAGKPAKVALIALVRKILVTLNAMMRDNTPFQA